MKTILSTVTRVLLAAALSAASVVAFAQADDCKSRGQLDTMYCDENKDLVADTPKDAKRWKNPSTLVFTYTPVEDPAVYENIFKPFTDYLAKCTAKKVVFTGAVERREIESMRSGGSTWAASDRADHSRQPRGRRPFAVRRRPGMAGYQFWLIVKKDIPLQKITGPQGQESAHVPPSSNSGQPRATGCSLRSTGARQGLQGAVLGQA